MSTILHKLKPVYPWLFYSALIIVTILLLIPIVPVPNQWTYTDKLEHMAAFATLALLGALSYENSLKNFAIGLALYGSTTEILQGTLSSTRHASVLDWLADCLGIAIGMLIFHLLKRCKLV